MRRNLELLLRVVAVAMLTILLWRHWPRVATPEASAVPVSMASASRQADSTGAATVDGLLRVLLRNPEHDAAPRAHLSVVAIPGPAARAALAAAVGGGLTLSWTDSSRASGLALGATSAPGTGDEVLLSASATPGALVMRDDGGVLDSLSVSASNTSLLVRRGASWMEAEQRGSDARVAVPAPLTRKRVLLFGRPGWETKFTVAALEEAGWKTDATLSISPRVSVTVGAPANLDTGRYAAAIVLDSGVARAATLARFVAQGGGVILSGDALLDRGLALLAPARVGGSRAAIPGGLLSPSPTSGLEAVRVTPLPDALVLQRESDRAPAVVVMRRGTGRVLASVYRESWRWRMEGGDDAEAAHRAWWLAQLRAVVYAPPIPEPGGADRTGAANTVSPIVVSNAAPYADLVARLGAPTDAPARVTAGNPAPNDRRYDFLLLGAAFAALLAEWASRRLRGAR
jgi:hypothetical protein